MKTPRLVLGTILAAGVLLAGGVSGVMAAHGGGGRAGGPAGGAIAFGTLASLSAGSATITTPGSASTTVTVTLASAATYTARSQAAAVAGLKTGDQVAVSGRSVNGAITANALQFDTTPFIARVMRFTGTVSAASTSSVTITTAAGNSITAPITSATVFGGSLASGGASALTTNLQVRITVAQLTDGTTVAQSISPAVASRSSAATPIATATATPTSTAP